MTVSGVILIKGIKKQAVSNNYNKKHYESPCLQLSNKNILTVFIKAVLDGFSSQFILVKTDKCVRTRDHFGNDPRCKQKLESCRTCNAVISNLEQQCAVITVLSSKH